MMNTIEMFKEFFRFAPCLYASISLILWSITQKIDFLFFFFLSIGNNIFNHLLKKFLYQFTSIRYITERPLKATHCQCVYNEFDTQASTPMGMPSGHCQSAGFTIGYWWDNIPNKGKPWALFILFLTVVSRLENHAVPVFSYLAADPHGCHTWSQTITGSVIGLLLGKISRDVQSKTIKFMKN